jgi:hypothetical protein
LAKDKVGSMLSLAIHLVRDLRSRSEAVRTCSVRRDAVEVGAAAAGPSSRRAAMVYQSSVKNSST